MVRTQHAIADCVNAVVGDVHHWPIIASSTRAFVAVQDETRITIMSRIALVSLIDHNPPIALV